MPDETSNTTSPPSPPSPPSGPPFGLNGSPGRDAEPSPPRPARTNTVTSSMKPIAQIVAETPAAASWLHAGSRDGVGGGAHPRCPPRGGEGLPLTRCRRVGLHPKGRSEAGAPHPAGHGGQGPPVEGLAGPHDRPGRGRGAGADRLLLRAAAAPGPTERASGLRRCPAQHEAQGAAPERQLLRYLEPGEEDDPPGVGTRPARGARVAGRLADLDRGEAAPAGLVEPHHPV